MSLNNVCIYNHSGHFHFDRNIALLPIRDSSGFSIVTKRSLAHDFCPGIHASKGNNQSIIALPDALRLN